MLKLKRQYFGHLMRRADSFENTLMLGTIEDEMVGWHHQLNGCESEQIQETVKVRRAWHGVHGVTELNTT